MWAHGRSANCWADGGNATVRKATLPRVETAIALKAINVANVGMIRISDSSRDGSLREHDAVPGLPRLLDSQLCDTDSLKSGVVQNRMF
jgi:hypothetical protein